jgi:hypothetical protein
MAPTPARPPPLPTLDDDHRTAPCLDRGMAWQGVSRHTLANPSTMPTGFESRYFELEPGAYSSLEKHRPSLCGAPAGR